MRRALIIGAMLAALTASATPAVGAGGTPTPVTGTELISMRTGLDGEAVVLEGEVIGDRLRGGDGHVWLNVLSGGTAIGVWAPRETAEAVGTFGTWSHTGDTVRVVGTFNEACDEHGGDLDVHATEIAVLASGGPRTDEPVGVGSLWKLAAGLGGLAVANLGWRRMRRAEEGGR